MTTERSLMAFEHYREAEQKFNYFITGLTVTLFAFLAKDFSPQALGRPEYAEILALILLLMSIYFGFKRIDITILVFQLNHKYLDAQEKLDKLRSNFDGSPLAINGKPTSPSEVLSIGEDLTLLSNGATDAIKRCQKRSKTYYDYRSLFLIWGFIAVVVARVLRAVS